MSNSGNVTAMPFNTAELSIPEIGAAAIEDAEDQARLQASADSGTVTVRQEMQTTPASGPSQIAVVGTVVASSAITTLFGAGRFVKNVVGGTLKTVEDTVGTAQKAVKLANGTAQNGLGNLDVRQAAGNVVSRSKIQASADEALVELGQREDAIRAEELKLGDTSMSKLLTRRSKMPDFHK